MQRRTDAVPSEDGVSIRYDVHRDGETTLLFVHGWCCDRHVWDQQADRLAARYGVVCLDLAGHGESGQDRKKFTISAFAQDVVAVVNHLGLKRVVLIGHSMGGGVIVEAARHLGSVVIGLVGVDTLFDVDKAAPSFCADFAKAARAFACRRRSMQITPRRSPPSSLPLPSWRSKRWNRHGSGLNLRRASMVPFRTDFAKAARAFARPMFSFDVRCRTLPSAIISARSSLAPAVMATEALESTMGNGH